MTAVARLRVQILSTGLAVLSLAAIASAAAPVAGKGDVAAVRAAVAEVVRAMEQGDAEALAAATTGDEPRRAWARAFANQRRALRQLHEALVKRFGKEYAEGEAGKELREQIDGLRDDDLLKDLKAAKPGEPRDNAVTLATDDGKPDDRQPRLVLAAGRWKLDLASLSEYMDPKDTPGLVSEAKAASKVAAEVAAGKIADVAAAAEALDESLATADDRKPDGKAPAKGKP